MLACMRITHTRSFIDTGNEAGTKNDLKWNRIQGPVLYEEQSDQFHLGTYS